MSGRIYGYGYKNGKVYVEEEQAEKIRKMYCYYLEGETILEAGRKAQLSLTKEALAHLLDREVYVGTSHFPALMEPELFYQVQKKRKEKTGVFQYLKCCEKKVSPETLRFYLPPVEKSYENPYRQAEHVYRLIEEA